MRTVLAIGVASVLVLGVTACGSSDHKGHTHASDTRTDRSTGAAIGHSTGIVRSVGSGGDFLTIDHAPFEGGIGMDAMTMGFGRMGSVDLSGFEEGDKVAFMVKKGRDGSYRIMSICKPSRDGQDCLRDMMDH